MIGSKITPLVSVIINCYNGDKYLKDAIDSIYKQTYKNWEVIFWDNCSTDQSAEIAKSYGEKVKYFYSDINTSLGEARNRALSKCTGDYIAFLDVDDIWYSNKLEVQINRMLSEGTSLSYTGCYIGENQIKTKRFNPKYESGLIFGRLIEKFEIILPAAVIKKEVLDFLQINFNSEIVASEEYDLFVQIAATYPVSVIEDNLCFYRVSLNSLTNKSINFRSRDRILTLVTLKKKYPEIVNANKASFNNAKYKIWYYRFQAALFNNNLKAAKLNINKIKFKDYRYFFIYLLIFISPKIYKKSLKIYDQRGI